MFSSAKVKPKSVCKVPCFMKAKKKKTGLENTQICSFVVKRRWAEKVMC